VWFITWEKEEKSPHADISKTKVVEICQLCRRPEDKRSRIHRTGGTVGWMEASRAGRITSAWRNREAVPRILRISRSPGTTLGCTSELPAALPRKNGVSYPSPDYQEDNATLDLIL